jgi:hypothetical protein
MTMSEKETKRYLAWVDLDFDFSSVELALEVKPDGKFRLAMNGTSIDHATSVEALREDSFDELCREVHEWIEDEIWGFIEDAVNEAWDTIESDKEYDEEDWVREFSCDEINER